MVRVSEPEVARRIVRSLDQTRTVFYVQRAIDHGGRDIRVFVVGGAVLGAIERRAPDGEWRTNVAIGGSATPFDLPDEWAQLARARGERRSAPTMRASICCRRATAGSSCSRSTAFPGWEGLQKATGIDVAGAIVDQLAARVQRGGASRRRRGMTTARTAADIAALAQLACLLEVSAPKPGNVSPGPSLRRSHATKTSWPVPSRSGRPFARVGRSTAGRDDPAGHRGDRVLDEDQHQSRHRAAARAAGQSRGDVRR